MQPQDQASSSDLDQNCDVYPDLDSDVDPEVEFISGMLGKIDQVKSWISAKASIPNHCAYMQITTVFENAFFMAYEFLSRVNGS